MNLIEQSDGTALGIRPEHVEVAVTPCDGWTEARVWVSEELGNETIVQLKIETQMIAARVKPDLSIEFDQKVWFRFRPDKLRRLS